MTDTDEVELWRDIPDLVGYQASNLGRIRSLRRRRPRLLTSTLGPCGYKTVTISGNAGPGGRGRSTETRCRRVGDLTAAAFIGPRGLDAELRHLNGDLTDDHLDNLSYGTVAEVESDMAARAAREEAAGAPTHCPNGHRYTPSWYGAWGERFCQDCEFLRRRANPYPYCVECGISISPRFKRCERCRITGGRCTVCGTTIPMRRKRCAPCSAAVKARRDREKRRESVARPSSITCPDCGVPVPVQDKGALPVTCFHCREARHRRRAQERADHQRQHHPPPPDLPCVDCGTPVAQRLHFTPDSPNRRFRCEPCDLEESRAYQRRARARRLATANANA